MPKQLLLDFHLSQFATFAHPSPANLVPLEPPPFQCHLRLEIPPRSVARATALLPLASIRANNAMSGGLARGSNGSVAENVALIDSAQHVRTILCLRRTNHVYSEILEGGGGYLLNHLRASQAAGSAECSSHEWESIINDPLGIGPNSLRSSRPFLSTGASPNSITI